MALLDKAIVVPLLALVFILIDIYFYQAIRVFFKRKSYILKKVFFYAYWSITALTVIGTFFYHLDDGTVLNNDLRNFMVVFVIFNYFTKSFGILLLLVEDGSRFIKWILNVIYNSPSKITPDLHGNIEDQQLNRDKILPKNGISRAEFLGRSAIIASAIPFVTMGYGLITGAHDYKIRRQRLIIPHLPPEFEGLRIGQISDIHCGSTFNKTAMAGGINMLLAEKPDVIFYTGDLVNYATHEVNEYIDIFSKVKADLGVYSTLGNHDYGDYRSWPSLKAKKQNFNDMLKAHGTLGWDLLLDKSRIIEKNGSSLAIIGVENWGAGRFQKYGDLQQAYQGATSADVKLLLSHDPTHWSSKVLPGYPDIDVTFSGHTHGFQMGIEVGSFRWSPSQYMYEHWAGLYQEGNQQLYVNRGFGTLGFPARVGMPPEITIFELSNKA